MRRLLAAAAVVSAFALSAPIPGFAQGSGWALSALAESEPLEGFFGPFRVQATGIEIRYNVLCYHSGTRTKAIPGQVAAFIPDGSSLIDIRTLSTTAIVNACNGVGILVPRGQVLLPASQLGL
jgi:hypothetical protein